MLEYKERKEPLRYILGLSLNKTEMDFLDKISKEEATSKGAIIRRALNKYMNCNHI